MTYDQCLEDLRKRAPDAAEWVEAVVQKAGTHDADWKVLEAAGLLLAASNPENQQKPPKRQPTDACSQCQSECSNDCRCWCHGNTHANPE